jgi:uncharacterized SAM-binding protein YcdF (DUF218 family)
VFYVLSKTLDILFSPITWVIAISILGFLAPRLQNARFACLASAAILYLFSITAVSNPMLRHLERMSEPSMRPTITYDAVIVLGGLVEHGAEQTWNEPSYNDNVERLLVAFDLLRKGRAKNAILTGGRNGPDDPSPEGSTLAKQLQDWGIEPGRLLIDDSARNTRENAVESKRIADARSFKTLLLVTSAFHMPRAAAAFKTVGLQTDLLPVDHRSVDQPVDGSALLPRATALETSSLVLRELFGRVVYGVVWH